MKNLSNPRREIAAKNAADYLRSMFRLSTDVPIGIVLGTGFGDKLSFDESESIPFEKVPGFSGLQALSGHNRRFMHGQVGGKEVIALSGRIHLNEDPGNPDILKMVRLQIETLLQLGVKKLILTCAAGSLPGCGLTVGNLVAIDSFVTVFAPQMPLWAGEFCSPEDTLSKNLTGIAFKQASNYPNGLQVGNYAMVLGPYFEGRKCDKLALANARANMVGMSVLPEACIAALYPEVEVLGLAFITNDAEKMHSHEENMKRAREFSKPLSEFLTRLIKNC